MCAKAARDSFGRGHDRLDVDVHFPSAGHADAQQFIGHVEGDQDRSAQFERAQGLAPDRTLRAAATDPTQ